MHNKNPYYIEDGILKRYIDDNKQRFEVIVLPQTLIESALQLAHEGLGHNGKWKTLNLCPIEMAVLFERCKTLCDQAHQVMYPLP